MLAVCFEQTGRALLSKLRRRKRVFFYFQMIKKKKKKKKKKALKCDYIASVKSEFKMSKNR